MVQKYEKRLKDGKYFNLFYLSSFIFTIITRSKLDFD